MIFQYFCKLFVPRSEAPLLTMSVVVHVLVFKSKYSETCIKTVMAILLQYATRLNVSSYEQSP